MDAVKLVMYSSVSVKPKMYFKQYAKRFTKSCQRLLSGVYLLDKVHTSSSPIILFTHKLKGKCLINIPT